MVCIAELRGLGAEAGARGVADPIVLAVAAHRPEELRDLQAALPPSIRLLADPERRAIDAYGLVHPRGGPGGSDIARPAVFVVGRDGRLAFARASETVLDRLEPAGAFDAWARAEQ